MRQWFYEQTMFLRNMESMRATTMSFTTTQRSQRPSAAPRQQGMVLFTALILLVILTLVGVMLTRLQTVEERISANDQDRQLAIQGGGRQPDGCALPRSVSTTRTSIRFSPTTPA